MPTKSTKTTKATYGSRIPRRTITMVSESSSSSNDNTGSRSSDGAKEDADRRRRKSRRRSVGHQEDSSVGVGDDESAERKEEDQEEEVAEESNVEEEESGTESDNPLNVEEEEEEEEVQQEAEVKQEEVKSPDGNAAPIPPPPFILPSPTYPLGTYPFMYQVPSYMVNSLNGNGKEDAAMKPGKFVGTGTPPSQITLWIEEMDIYLQCTKPNWCSPNASVEDKDKLVKLIATYFKDDALRWYHNVIKSTPIPDWDTLKIELKKRFIPISSETTARIKLDSIRQSYGESVNGYTQRFLPTMQEINDMHEKDRVHHFIRGLNKDLQKETLKKEPSTLKDAMDIAAREEAIYYQLNGTNNGGYKPIKGKWVPMDPQEANRRLYRSHGSPAPYFRYGNGRSYSSTKTKAEVGNNQANRAVVSVSASSNNTGANVLHVPETDADLNVINNNSGNTNHTPTNFKQLTPQQIEQYKKENKCFYCGERNHTARYCSKRREAFKQNKSSKNF